MKYDPTKYAKMKEIFKLCDVPKSSDEIQDLIDYLADSLGTMAMVNYPYETNFLNKLPAWPQKYACD